jgi:cyclic pyranopterin phosphate synthase
MQDKLTDSQGRIHDYLRISLTGRCNLNCSYCRPSGAGDCHRSTEPPLSDSELLLLVELLAGMGVRKVRLTGGEPLLRRGIERLVQRISAVPGIETVAMTTNGTLLEPRLDGLVHAGLRRLNISLDSLDPERLRLITGQDCFDSVWSGIEAALEYVQVTLKINTVVMREVNDSELTDFVELTRRMPLSVRFIEYMPFADNRWQPDRLVGWREMTSRISDVFTLEELGQNGVAREFRVKGFAGTVGFIAPLTGCFCGACSRLRLSADGHLRLCLHHADELNLGGMLRGGLGVHGMELAVRDALDRKPDGHGRIDTEDGAARACASMVSIGG